MRVDLIENLYRAAAALEHVDDDVRIALVSTQLIEAAGGEWSEPVRYRFREDSHPGVVIIDLKTEPAPSEETDAELLRRVAGELQGIPIITDPELEPGKIEVRIVRGSPADPKADS